MLTKLILSIYEAVIAHAKVYAKKRQVLLPAHSALLGDDSSEMNKSEPSRKLNKLIGAENLPKDFNEKKELRTVLEKKHL